MKKLICLSLIAFLLVSCTSVTPEKPETIEDINITEPMNVTGLGGYNNSVVTNITTNENMLNVTAINVTGPLNTT